MARPRTEPEQEALTPRQEPDELAERVASLEANLGPAVFAISRALDRAMPDVRSLDERMAAVQLELEDVPRAGHATVTTKSGSSYSYDYITEADLMKAVRPLLSKHGIATYYSDRIVERGDGWARVAVEIVLRANGEQMVLAGESFATDFGDKAASKAKTTAVRYLLWKTFLQPSDEDPEQENVSQADAERAARQQQPRRAPQANRAKLVERIGQLSLEADEIAGRTPGATLGAIPELAKEAFSLVEPYPNGASDQELVAIGTQLSQFVAAERARKEADPDAYSPAELEIAKA